MLLRSMILMACCAVMPLARHTLAQTSANSDRVLRLRGTMERIRIDGVIDEVWATADSSDAFVQHSPAHAAAPSRRTVAKVLATEQALYCLIVCHEDKGMVAAPAGVHDDANGDFVSIMLDTFGDRKSAYKFVVSASGVRTDARLLDDARNRDYSWDGVWFADARLYDWGYVVEMELPFRSLQYDPVLTEWGLDFDRWIPARAEDIYWCAYSENEGQRISRFGRLLLNDVRPGGQGLSLELYPVGITQVRRLREGVYEWSPDAGLDVFYNPSPILTVQGTVNPDFAQIEADPFAFNISRYESYFNERRPFFTEGKEIFTASGKQHNSGFYQPLELFYSRRIGRKLPDGRDVPLLGGAKIFGRAGAWEYGGFVATTGERDYRVDGEERNEEAASFVSARLKRQVLDNSDIGMLYVGKLGASRHDGVLDIDGALRGSPWQLSYQLARSMHSDKGGGLAASAGLAVPSERWTLMARARYVESTFDAQQVGFVPWVGSSEVVLLTGPTWYIKEHPVKSVMLYTGGALSHEVVDKLVDLLSITGASVQFRANYGMEVNWTWGRARDNGVAYTSWEATFSSWFHTHPRWYGNVWGGYSRTYNFRRNWLSFYSWAGLSFDWDATDNVALGMEGNVFIEGDPDLRVEDVTVATRPSFTITPVNNVSVRVYVDHVYERSSDRVQRLIGGLLFSWNFLPKSWIYLAWNDVREREHTFDTFGTPTGSTLRIREQAAVLKVKYLYYL